MQQRMNLRDIEESYARDINYPFPYVKIEYSSLRAVAVGIPALANDKLSVDVCLLEACLYNA